MKIKKIALIGLLFVVVISGIAAVVSKHPETTRFETEFLATTADNVTIKIRAFGDCLKEVDVNAEIIKFQEAMREKVAQIEHAEITKKLKLKFREIVNKAEERGLDIDSLSQSDPEKDDY